MAVRRETGPYPPLASAGETGTCPSGQTGAPSFPPQPAAPEVPASGDQAGLALADAVRGAAGATASIAAKTVVSADNLARHTDLTSPGVQWSVRNGLRMTVIDPRPVPLPDAYREATERYAGDVSLAADLMTGHSVVRIEAGHVSPTAHGNPLDDLDAAFASLDLPPLP